MASDYPPLRNANLVHRDRLTPLEKLAVFISSKFGSVSFFFITFFWTFTWIAWNSLAPVQFRFDPQPGFILWMFISNLIQIHLLPIIMISQNIQSQHAQTRAELDYATNQKSEARIEEILTRLNQQEKILQDILKSTNQK